MLKKKKKKKKKLSPLTKGQTCSLLKFEAQIKIQIFLKVKD